MSRLLAASISLDLDDLWTYMKTHGDEGWKSYPSYLETAVPRFLNVLAKHRMTASIFVVGQDAAFARNHAVLRSMAVAGHEICNHSFHHEPWLHLYSKAELEQEIESAQTAIFEATGRQTIGFRGPGFSYSPDLLRVLARRGYLFDASTFPTFIGPLARIWYFFKSRLNRQQQEERSLLFGSWKEGFLSIRPYQWKIENQVLWEIPVTTMPAFRLPIHLSYILFLGQISQTLALTYLNVAILLCKLFGVGPSFLLHPLDFLSLDEAPQLAFFPAMQMPLDRKLALVDSVLDRLRRAFSMLPMSAHCETLAKAGVSKSHSVANC